VTERLDALAGHCDRLGRNRSEIKVTKQMMVCVAPTMEEAHKDLAEIAVVKGWNNDLLEMMKAFIPCGDPDTVGEKLTEFLNLGIDGFTLSLPANGHKTDSIGLLAEAANKAMKEVGK
jgi:alkanesulfonate monooxygenase SsuD/methylene tetrahydromethanopterin reductase-like flavin-dependent oxidoreductase (luciferase family)